METPSKILSSELDNKLGCKLVYGGDGYLIAKLAKCSRQHLSALLLFSGCDFGALLDEAQAFMQDLPNETTKPMSHGPDGGLIAQAGQQTPEHDLKVTASLCHRRVGCLVQHPAHVFIAFGGTAVMVLLRAFLFARTGPHPRG
jgi:hypothetical protein